jgi:hypothetical protein
MRADEVEVTKQIGAPNVTWTVRHVRDKRSLLAIAVKAEWDLGRSDDFNGELKYNVERGEFQRVVDDLFCYMIEHALLFAVVTTYERTWFLLRTDYHVRDLHITTAVHRTADDPSVQDCMYYVLSHALDPLAW